MKKYVVGALFNDDGSNVALILKNRPDFLNGKLNFIGGHIESYDTSPLEAMKREAKEEAGVDVDWKFVSMYKDEGYEIFYFTTFSSAAYDSATTLTDEVIVKCETNNLPADTYQDVREFIAYVLNKNK